MGCSLVTSQILLKDSENQPIAEQKAATQIRRFPQELELQILAISLIPQQPCIRHHFGQCHDEWACKQYLNHSRPIFTPDPTLLSVCKSWRHDALKYFFTHNTFIFNNGDRLSEPMVDEDQWSWQEWRDPHATRLLDFVDRPDWKGCGSRRYQYNCQHFSFSHSEQINRYRHLIRRMALIFNCPTREILIGEGNHIGGNDEDEEDNEGLDLEWILKVDWQALPDLETLYLDFTWAIVKQGRQVSLLPSIVDCAARMKCLSLKKLVLMNVDISWVVAEKEMKNLGALFEGALGSLGQLEIYVNNSMEW